MEAFKIITPTIIILVRNHIWTCETAFRDLIPDYAKREEPINMKDCWNKIID